MQRDAVIAKLKAHEATLRARGVASLSLFGSLARGDERPDSDVDVLIDLAPDADFSLLDHADVQVFLCDLLGRETDVVVRDGLRPRVRARIEPDELRVF
jgi:predicted nucleotidyltransferase